MISVKDYSELADITIAKGERDASDYENNGWLAIEKDGVVAIAQFGHCSCYGTYDDIFGVGDYNGPGHGLAWEGTKDEAIAMARRLADPSMPERQANPQDYDFGLLVQMYDALLAHFGETR